MSNSMIEVAVASWETPYSEETWRRLEGVKTDVRFETGRGENADFLLVGPILPSPGEAESRIAQVIVHRGRGSGGGLDLPLSWSMTIRRAPSGEPPESVQIQSKKLGGQRGLMRLIDETTAPRAPPVGAFQVNLLVERARYECRGLPLPVDHGGPHDIAASLGRGVWMEQIGYRFENGVNGLEEIAIVYDHQHDIFSVNVQASGMLKLGSATWFPYADDVAELVLKAFFVPGRHGQ
jgi:hypothetical protein